MMNFGAAIAALRAGECVARIGWNGKGMHIYLEDSFSWCMPHVTGGKRPKLVRGRDRVYEPVIIMFTAQKTHQPGWLASQADMLADDWMVVDPDRNIATQPAAPASEGDAT